VDIRVQAMSSGTFSRATFNLKFAAFAGFTEEEVKALIQQVADKIKDDNDHVKLPPRYQAGL